MSLTVNAKTYTQDAVQKDSVGYAGPANTLSSKDYIVASRTAPKPTAQLSGVARTEVKLTRTLTLTGALTPSHEAILRIPVSIPVGASSADIDSMLNDMGSFLASATFKTIVKNLTVNI